MVNTAQQPACSIPECPHPGVLVGAGKNAPVFCNEKHRPDYYAWNRGMA